MKDLEKPDVFTFLNRVISGDEFNNWSREYECRRSLSRGAGQVNASINIACIVYIDFQRVGLVSRGEGKIC